ncbi:MAG: CobD/CbiB family protein [Burkholderiales bacterium]
MSLLALIFALLLEQVRPVDPKGPLFSAFFRYADVVARNFNAGRRVHGVLGWMAAVLPWVILADVGFYLLNAAGFLFGLLWSVAVLYLAMGLRQFSHHFTAIQQALRDGQLDVARAELAKWTGRDTAELTAQEMTRIVIESGLSSAHRHVFGVVAWYVFLPAVLGSLLPGPLGALLSGPGGAVLYRLTSALNDRWGARAEDEFRAFGGFAKDLYRILDWVPVRLTGLSFAIVGDFEDAVYCWRSQAAAWFDPQQGIVLSSGAGALGVRLGDALHESGQLVFRPELGLGDEPDLEHLNSAVGLIWRALVLWVLLIALMTVASWVN